MPTDGNEADYRRLSSRSGSCAALDYNELCVARGEITGIESLFGNDPAMIVMDALSAIKDRLRPTV